MESIYIKNIKIEKVRHLSNIEIPITEDKLKHLIITGKNGSGKTSLLDALAKEISELVEPDNLLKKEQGLSVDMSLPTNQLKNQFETGEVIIAHYNDERKLSTISTTTVEKVEFQTSYSMNDTPAQYFVKYLLDMKMTQALAMNAGKKEKVEKIQKCFDSFEKLLQRIFDEEKLRLVFDEESFLFHIEEPGREPFDFNVLSSGYAAILDIVVDLMLRMEKYKKKTFLYDLPGIVLIDEIETHLHLEMQKNVMELLTSTFPRIQFIVSTHSPYILNSIENACIYDLEKQVQFNDFSNYSAEDIAEGYFDTEAYSKTLQIKIERYKELVNKKDISEEDRAERSKIRRELQNISRTFASEMQDVMYFTRLKKV